MFTSHLVWSHLKQYARQMGSFPQFSGVNIKNGWKPTPRKAWILDSKPCKPNIRSGIFLKRVQRVFFWLVWGSSLDVALKYHFIWLKSCQKLLSKKIVIKKINSCNCNTQLLLFSYPMMPTMLQVYIWLQPSSFLNLTIIPAKVLRHVRSYMGHSHPLAMAIGLWMCLEPTVAIAMGRGPPRLRLKVQTQLAYFFVLKNYWCRCMYFFTI